MPLSNPSSIINYLSLREGMKVADFGAGTGAYTFPAADRVGTTGRVYAVEVQEGMTVRMRSEIKTRGYTSVEAIYGDIESPGGSRIGDSTLDAVILANTLFLVPDKKGMLREIARVLRPGGSLLLVDWSGSTPGIGPVPEMVIPSERARELIEPFGFSHTMDIPAPGEHHYGMIFVRSV